MSRFTDILKGKNDEGSKEERSFFRWFIFSSVVFILISGFFAQNSIYRWVKAGIEIRKQNKQIEYYQNEIDQMEKSIRSLKDNRDSLEHYAREQFGFTEPGDEVYIDNK